MYIFLLGHGIEKQQVPCNSRHFHKRYNESTIELFYYGGQTMTVSQLTRSRDSAEIFYFIIIFCRPVMFAFNHQ